MLATSHIFSCFVKVVIQSAVKPDTSSLIFCALFNSPDKKLSYAEEIFDTDFPHHKSIVQSLIIF
jgi:hypothetical protein